jgi:hypothetical protein
VDAKVTLLAGLTQEAEGVRPLLEQRRQTVRILTEREIQRQRDASSIRKWTTVGATAVTLGGMLFPGAGPAVGASIGWGIDTAGEAAYQHNTTGLGWSDIRALAAKGTVFYQGA